MIEASWLALVDAIEYKLARDAVAVLKPVAGRCRDPLIGAARSLFSGSTKIAEPCSRVRLNARASQTIRSRRRPGALVCVLARKGYFHADPTSDKKPLHDRHPAAQRDRGLAPGPRAQQHASGHSDPLAADAGLRRPLDARHRSRRHRHAGRGRAADLRGREEDPARHRPRGARRRGSGSGRTSTKSGSSASCACMGCRATGAARGSRSTRSARAPCATRSSSCSRTARSIAANGW